MVNEMLLEHEAPSLDGVEESLFEWLGVYTEPMLKDCERLNFLSLFIDFLIGVNLFFELV